MKGGVGNKDGGRADITRDVPCKTSHLIILPNRGGIKGETRWKKNTSIDVTFPLPFPPVFTYSFYHTFYSIIPNDPKLLN